MGLQACGSHIYTSLFEVCASYTGDKQLALDRATYLLGGIRNSNIEISPVAYKVCSCLLLIISLFFNLVVFS